MIADALKDTPPNQIAFLLGATHDHLADFVTEMIQWDRQLSSVSHQCSIADGCREFTSHRAINYDIQNADLILSFGANFLETWGSPVSYTRQYAAFRKGTKGKRGTLIQFEPRMSQTAAVADQWIPILPGTEYFVAMALGPADR